MLDHPKDIVRALIRYNDIFDPYSCSMLTISVAPPRVDRDPFGGGFIAGLEERRELVRLWRSLIREAPDPLLVVRPASSCYPDRETARSVSHALLSPAQ